MSVSAAPTFKTAFYTMAVTAFASDQAVQVTYGMPAFDPFNDVIAVGAVTSESEAANLGTRRQREETLTLEVNVYSFVGGGQEAEATAMTRAYSLLATLEEYVRVTDTTLGGVVRWCFLTGHASDQATDQEVLAYGRMCVVTATFTAHNRITS